MQCTCSLLSYSIHWCVYTTYRYKKFLVCWYFGLLLHCVTPMSACSSLDLPKHQRSILLSVVTKNYQRAVYSLHQARYTPKVLYVVHVKIFESLQAHFLISYKRPHGIHQWSCLKVHWSPITDVSPSFLGNYTYTRLPDYFESYEKFCYSNRILICYHQ